MPAFSKNAQEYHKSRIRTIMILRPDATIEEIRTALQESLDNPITLDRKYINKLREKIFRERARVNTNLNKTVRLRIIREKLQMVERRLWAEAMDPKNPGVVRVVALKAIGENEIKLLNAEMDAGIYDRQLGTLKEERRMLPLTEDTKKLVTAAMRNWGLIETSDPNTPRLSHGEPLAN
jgi:hypothetical protein